jgi:hypothetical protein
MKRLGPRIGIATMAAAMVAIMLVGAVPQLGTNAGTGRVSSPVSTLKVASTYSFPTPIQHVYEILMENAGVNQTIGATGQPFETYLANTYAYAGTDYYAQCHPSTGNYISLVSGAADHCGSDGAPGTNGSPWSLNNLGNQLQASGLSWVAYEEEMTTPCQATNYPGNYAVRHNPFPYFSDIAGSVCDTHDLPIANLTSGAGVDGSYFNRTTASNVTNYTWITPDLLNDGHNTTPAVGDHFLKAFVSQLVNESWFSSTVIFVTYDESGLPQVNTGYAVAGVTPIPYCVSHATGPTKTTDVACGGPVATIVVSPYTLGVGAAYTAHQQNSHYDLLSTVDWLLNLGGEGNSSATSTTFPPMSSLFKFPPPTQPTGLSVSPSSTTSLSLAWMNPSGTGGTLGAINNITSYWYTGSSCSNADFGGSTSLGVVTTAQQSGLSPASVYSFKVQAWNGFGGSPDSACVAGTTQPNPPTGLAIHPAYGEGNTSLPLAWTNPTGILVNDTVYWGEAVSGSCASTTDDGSYGAGVINPYTSYTITGLTSNTEYCIWVTAWSSSASTGQSGASGILVNYTLPKEVVLVSWSATTSSITMTWTNPSGTLTHTKVEWGRLSGTCSTNSVAYSGSVISTWTQTGLAAGSEYCFRVVTTGIVGQSWDVSTGPKWTFLTQ